MESISTANAIFNLGSSYETAAAVALNEPTEISDIIILASWNQDKITSPFVLTVYYYDARRDVRMIHFTKFNFFHSLQCLFISRVAAKKYEGFMCTNIQFHYSREKDSEVLIKVEAYKFDDIKEKEG